VTVVLAALTCLAGGGCGRTAREYLLEAQNARSLEEREDLLSKALHKAPDLTEARLQRAWVYAQQEELEAALADYDALRDALDSRADRAALAYWRGRALELNGLYAEAVADYSAALRHDPRFLNPYVARAGAHFKRGRYAEAMADYLTMLDRDIHRQGEAANERRGERRLRRGIAALCAGEWESAAGDLLAAAGLLRSPDLEAAAMLHLYGVACRGGGKAKADKALIAYARRSHARARVGRRGQPWPVPAVWYAAGLIDEAALLEAARTAKAGGKTDREAEARYYVGARHLVEGNVEAAREAFQACTAHEDPESAEFHLARAELERIETGAPTAEKHLALVDRAASREEKIKLCSLALRTDPARTDARMKRAALYALGGDYDPAIADYTRVLDACEAPAARAVALQYRAWALARKGDHAAAVRDYEAAVSADPELRQAREGLAGSLCHLREYARAAEVYTALIRSAGDPEMRAFWQLERGLARSCAGKWAAAVADLEAVLEAPPAPPVVRTQLYVLQCKLGRKAEATKALRAYADAFDRPGWESSVACFAAGAIDADRLLRASAHSEEGVGLLRTSRAHYYVGAARRIEGREAEARAAFERCVELGGRARHESWEYRLALTELADKAEGR